MNSPIANRRGFFSKLAGATAALAGLSLNSKSRVSAAIGTGNLLSNLTLSASTYAPKSDSQIALTATLSRLDGVVDGTLAGVPVEFWLGDLTRVRSRMGPFYTTVRNPVGYQIIVPPFRPRDYGFAKGDLMVLIADLNPFVGPEALIAKPRPFKVFSIG